ncbi:MAG: pyridoxal phosphate-dependent aminotransferase [Clostridiales Family XIII bacterium]|jgi:aspartate aminotransferase|nr:pyridoxal phosphate-dependent aminotransferase [Clostridiales Family XIII bacterium]
MKLSKKIQGIQASPIRKFFKYTEAAKNAGKKVYFLNIGQPDIKTPPVFMEAIRNDGREIVEYGPSAGTPLMISAVQEYYRRYGMEFTQDEIIVTCGGSEALRFIVDCVCDEGDEIIIPEPFYTNYGAFIRASGGVIVPLTTTPENGYRYADRAAIDACVTPRSRALLLTNPGNPTGVVLSPEEMRLIGQAAKDHDLFIISDEVYREFVYDGKQITSFGQIPDIADRVILVDSVSKRFSACGARIGTVLSKNRDLLESLLKLAQSRLCAPTLDQLGSAALYRMDPGYFTEIRAEFEKRRDAAYEELSKIDGIVCMKPPGAFYITAKLPVENAEEFLIWLLREFDDGNETVMFTPAEGFYATEGLGRSEIRIAYVLNEQDLRRGIELIRLALSAYRRAGAPLRPACPASPDARTVPQ